MISAPPPCRISAGDIIISTATAFMSRLRRRDMSFLFAGVMIGCLITAVALTTAPGYRRPHEHPPAEAALLAKCAEVERLGRQLFQSFALWASPRTDPILTAEDMQAGASILAASDTFAAKLVELQRVMNGRSFGVFFNLEAARQEMTIISHRFTSRLKADLQREYATNFQVKLQAIEALCAAATRS